MSLHVPIILPSSSSTVIVRAINTTTRLSCAAEGFVTPQLPGHSIINLPTLAFLIEHNSHLDGFKRTVLFDCGSRKDWWNFAPKVQHIIQTITPGLHIEKGIDEILREAHIDLTQVEALIWSHWHWDHCGDASLFPPETEIVVGSGFKETFLPGYPANPESPMLQADFERTVREIDFVGAQKIGNFESYDYFGDGSLYLLNTPGHAIGHMCALARTTPTTFVFLGGDICHFPGMFRPSAAVQMPDPIPAVTPLDPYLAKPCPCSVFADIHPRPLSSAHHPSPLHDYSTGDVTRSTPFYAVSAHANSAYADPAVAANSIAGLAAFDADEDVLVCLAHDGALLQTLPLLNDNPTADLSEWKKRGWKERVRWEFLNELPRGGRKGREDLVQGLWKNGQVVTG